MPATAPAAPRTVKRKRAPKAPRKPESSYVLVAPPLQPGETPPPPVPVLLSPDLLFNRERAYAMHAVAGFRGWLLEHMAARSVTLDHWPYTDVFDMLNAARRRGRLSDGNRSLLVVELLTAFVEANLLLRVRFPAYRVVVEDEPDDDWAPRDESEAVAVGLSIRHPRKSDPRPEAELPGCQGDGGRCVGLRRFGERFCPSHRAAELKRMRGG